MDATTEKLVDYAINVRYDSLTASTVEACKLRILDTLGCVAGGYDHPVSVAARTLAGRYSMDQPATMLGSRARVAPEMAAFANGVMLRVLDLSDMYRVKSGGHPSDIIAAALAAAELGDRNGRSLITAIAVGYEVYCSCCEAIDLNSKGWDQPVYGIVAAVLAASKLLDLDRIQMAHALALALVPNMALYQTRQGELSSWKGCAAANASRNALFAVLLAQAGFTGADAPFEGKSGLWNVVGRFEWPLQVGVPPYRIARTHLKCFPICYHGQSAVWTALDMRERFQVEDVATICIYTYRTAFNLMANDPSRWAPATHETADHSLPFVVSVALLDGAVSESCFSQSRLRDPRLAALMSRTSVCEDELLSMQSPESSPCRIIVRLKDGSEIINDLRYPKGHDRNPMSTAEVEDKFKALFSSYGSLRQAERMIALVDELDRMKDIGALASGFARRSRKRGAGYLSGGDPGRAVIGSANST